MHKFETLSVNTNKEYQDLILRAYVGTAWWHNQYDEIIYMWYIAVGRDNQHFCRWLNVYRFNLMPLYRQQLIDSTNLMRHYLKLWNHTALSSSGSNKKLQFLLWLTCIKSLTKNVQDNKCYSLLKIL